MRIYLSLIITSILLSFSTAYFAFSLQKETLATPEEINDIRTIEADFSLTHKPTIELDLASMYPTRGNYQLIQPLLNPFGEPQNISQACNSGPMSKKPSNKGEIWEAYRCHEMKTLPEDFFEIPPYIHDNGESFAKLAYSSGQTFFRTNSWIKDHLNFFHVSELRELPGDVVDSRFYVLGRLSSTELENIIQGQKFILSEDNYLIRNSKSSGHVYGAYPRAELDRFLNQKSFSLKTKKPSDKCFFEEGNLCWQKDAPRILQLMRPSSILIFVSSMVILILVSFSLYSKIKLQGIEEERKRHALRVLTHELRTPITNLLLQVEDLNSRGDQMNHEVQEGILKMEGEIYRLKRLAEKSSSYLNSTSDKKLISFDLRTVESINSFIQELLNDQFEEVRITALEEDCSLMMDAYWFNICLKNIVENAYLHGSAPVALQMKQDKDFVHLTISDEGSFKTEASSSRGLGMGLSIVEKIMNEMKGKMSIHKNPTQITLSLAKKI